MGYRSTYNRRLRAMRRLKKRLAVASLLTVGVCTAALLMLREPLPMPMPLGAGQSLEADAAPLRQPGQAVAAAAPAAHAGTRRIYPYSIVPGGVSGRAEVVHVLQIDQVVAQHYAGLQVARMGPVTVKAPRAVYVSYRKGDKVYWTAQKVMLAQGETLLSDGGSEIRTRCGNRISDVPRLPVEADGPSGQMLDMAMNMDADDPDADGGDGGRQAGASTAGAGADSASSAQPVYLASLAYGGAAGPATMRAPAALALLGMPSLSGASATLPPITRTSGLVSLTPVVLGTQTGVTADAGVAAGTPGTPGVPAGSDTGGGDGGIPGTGSMSGTASVPGATGTNPPTGAGGSSTTPLGADGDPPSGDGGGATLPPLLPALTPPNTPPIVIAKTPARSAQVPEPDSLALSGIALALMLLLRRKPRQPRQG